MGGCIIVALFKIELSDRVSLAVGLATASYWRVEGVWHLSVAGSYVFVHQSVSWAFQSQLKEFISCELVCLFKSSIHFIVGCF